MASSDIELLLAYLDGSLPLSESALVESRLKGETPLARIPTRTLLANIVGR